MSPSSRSSAPVTARAPLHRYPEYRLYEQTQVIGVAVYKKLASGYSESFCKPRADVIQISPSGDASKSQTCNEDGHVGKMVEDEMDTFIVE